MTSYFGPCCFDELYFKHRRSPHGDGESPLILALIDEFMVELQEMLVTYGSGWKTAFLEPTAGYADNVIGLTESDAITMFECMTEKQKHN